MTFFEQLSAFDRLNALIKRKGTGTPQALAEKLGVSLATVYNYLRILRENGAPIAYCQTRESYYYKEEGEFVIICEFKKITNGGGKNILSFFEKNSPL